MQDLGRVANPRPVAKIKTGRVSQPITDAADATGIGNWNANYATRLPGHGKFRLGARCNARLSIIS